MADRSKIEWTDATWNPLRATHIESGKVGWHCEKLSPACDHCYAAVFNGRNLKVGTGLPYVRGSREMVVSAIDEETLFKPFAWKRRRKIFVCSMTDLFGDWVSDLEIARVFAVAWDCQWHTFQFLTKRAARAARLLNCIRFRAVVARQAYEMCIARKPEMEGIVSPDDVYDEVFDLWPLPNAWIGVTAEDQKWADVRIPALLASPAAARFVSYEPALGPIDFAKFGKGLDQIIWGGESGHKARPPNPAWARETRDFCQATGVAFFLKQWGEWRPLRNDESIPDGPRYGEFHSRNGDFVESCLCDEGSPGAIMVREGKTAAGRMLDGRVWSQFPEVAHV